MFCAKCGAENTDGAKSQGNDFENNNKFIVVFSATVSNTEGDFEPLTVYYPVEYDGIVKFSDNDYMVTSITDILGNSRIPDSWYSTKGYVDGEEMYSELITFNRDNYKYEVSDGLKQFGH